MNYQEALKAKNDKSHPLHAKVDKARKETKNSVVFATLYGAGAPKIEEGLGLEKGGGDTVLERFFNRYKECKVFRVAEEKRFCTADTEHWDLHSCEAMARSASDMTGATRHFDFEADMADALWKLGMNLGRYSSENVLIPTGVITRSKEKGQQTILGACRSAFLGAALTIQKSVCRAAINTPIQMTGANLTKLLGARFWAAMHCPFLNVHDEIIFADHPNFNENTALRIVNEFENEFRTKVKYLKFDAKHMERWSDK